MNKLKYTIDFLKQAHNSTSCHKQEVMESDLCGCFYCLETYAPSEIEEWIMENDNRGETTICPKCGIDSVLSSKLPVNDQEFLKEMHHVWFESD